MNEARALNRVIPLSIAGPGRQHNSPDLLVHSYRLLSTGTGPGYQHKKTADLLSALGLPQYSSCLCNNMSRCIMIGQLSSLRREATVTGQPERRRGWPGPGGISDPFPVLQVT